MVFHDVSMNFVKILGLHESFLWPHKLNYVIRWGRHDKIILGLNLITFINTFILLATESEKYQPKCLKIVKISEPNLTCKGSKKFGWSYSKSTKSNFLKTNFRVSELEVMNHFFAWS